MKDLKNTFIMLSDDMYNTIKKNTSGENSTLKAIGFYLDYLFIYLEYVLAKSDVEKNTTLVTNLINLKKEISPLIAEAYTKLKISREVRLDDSCNYMDAIKSEVVNKMNNFCNGDVCYLKYHSQDVFSYLENIARSMHRPREQAEELCHHFTTAKSYLVIFMGIS